MWWSVVVACLAGVVSLRVYGRGLRYADLPLYNYSLKWLQDRFPGLVYFSMTILNFCRCHFSIFLFPFESFNFFYSISLRFSGKSRFGQKSYIRGYSGQTRLLGHIAGPACMTGSGSRIWPCDQNAVFQEIQAPKDCYTFDTVF